jgi:O-antigen ligase
MFICLVVALVMVHNGHTQQITYMGEGWALHTHSVGRIDLGERRITYLGFFSDPNDLGMFLVMCIPFTIYFFSRGKFLTKLLMLLVLTSLGYGAFITGSRGTMVGAVALIGTYFLITYAGPKLFIASIIVAPIFAVVATTLQKNIDESANQRLEAWYHGIQMAMSNPLFGIGKAQFVEVHGRTAHNSYILILGELGFVGYSLWGGALIFTVFSAFKFLKYNKNKIQKGEEETEDNDKKTALKNEFMLNQTLLFSMVGFMVTGFFLSRSYTLLLFIFLGMTLASHIRLVKLEPALEQFFNTETALRSMMYSWVVIIAVYVTLKIGL